MRIFSDLGEAIERRWCKVNYAESAFPRIAEQAIRRFGLARVVEPESVVRWLLEASDVPLQHLNASFGQPPVMAFRGSRFFVEILFWIDGNTAIHQHGFSGAFMVLAGSSIHARYRFALRTPVNSSIRVGALRRTSVELLRKGDVRQILAGDGLIHCTFHLDRPTLTLVIRTFSESTGTPQYAYLPPAIAFDTEAVTARLDRQLKLLVLLRECGSPTFATNAASFLRRTDYYGATLFFRRHYEGLRQESPATFKRLLAVARTRHGKLCDAWPEVFAAEARQNRISLRRSQVEDPEHRFFLAVLLNFSDRASILTFIAKRFPGRSPKKLVLAWVRALFPLTFGAASLTVVGWLVDGLSWSGIVARLRKESEPGDFARQKRNVRALVKKLRESLLQPLFA